MKTSDLLKSKGLNDVPRFIKIMCYNTTQVLPVDKEDLEQDVWIKLLQCNTFDPYIPGAGAYIKRVIWTEALRQLNKSKNTVYIEDVVVADNLSSHGRFETIDANDIVEKSLQLITQREKEVLCMLYGLGQDNPSMTMAEIAKHYDVSVQAINIAKNRALRTIRTRLKGIDKTDLNTSPKEHKHRLKKYSLAMRNMIAKIALRPPKVSNVSVQRDYDISKLTLYRYIAEYKSNNK